MLVLTISMHYLLLLAAVLLHQPNDQRAYQIHSTVIYQVTPLGNVRREHVEYKKNNNHLKI